MMKTEGLKQEADGSLIESTERTTYCRSETEQNLEIFPTVPVDEMEAVIKKENCNESVISSADDANSEIIEATADGDHCNPKTAKTVTFETIPKIETVGDDSSDEEDYTPSLKTYSDGDSINSEPEIDPFADVDCEPSFSQNLGQNNTGLKDSSDPSSSSAKRILPTTASTSNYKRQRKRLGNKLKCQLCLETQSSETSLKTHLEICAASHKHRCRFCAICNTLFSFPQGYRVHALRIHGIDQVEAVAYPLKCELCPKAFSRIESLNAHKTLCHEETHSTQHDGGDLKQKPFKCQDCPSSFAELSGLTAHGKSHKTDRPFKCPELNCGKAFKFSGNLKEHLKCIHSEEKSIKCQEPNCGKIFKTKVQLVKHMLCHTELRPFQCLLYPGCSKTFKSKDGLTKHIKAHKGARRYTHIDITERPFKCSQCDRAYCKNWQLTSHLKAHSTEIFECPEPKCGMKCRYKHNLEIHISNSHTNKDELPYYQCQEPNCGKKFKHKQSLSGHLRRHTWGSASSNVESPDVMPTIKEENTVKFV